jgi:hypothetical protein
MNTLTGRTFNPANFDRLCRLAARLERLIAALRAKGMAAPTDEAEEPFLARVKRVQEIAYRVRCEITDETILSERMPSEPREHNRKSWFRRVDANIGLDFSPYERNPR